MAEQFEIDVPVNNSIRVFEARIQKTGKKYKVVVSIDGREIIFEPDPERKFRAIVKFENYKKSLSDSIQATAQVLSDLFRDGNRRL